MNVSWARTGVVSMVAVCALWGCGPGSDGDGDGGGVPVAEAAVLPPEPMNPHLNEALAFTAQGNFAAAKECIRRVETQPDLATAIADMRARVLDEERRFAGHYADPHGDTRVTVLANPSHSYELYIPPEYDPGVPHPILYVFNSDANGRSLMMHCLPGAQAQGWIIAASNNSKNGPWREIFHAQDMMVADTEARLNLHPTRRYATGFSGGARASLALAFRQPAKICGVLAMGAGWPVNTDLAAHNRNLKVAILIGTQDSNIKGDIPQTIQKLQAAGVTVATDTYEAGHEWPQRTVVTGSLRWLAEQTKDVG